MGIAIQPTKAGQANDMGQSLNDMGQSLNADIWVDPSMPTSSITFGYKDNYRARAAS